MSAAPGRVLAGCRGPGRVTCASLRFTPSFRDLHDAISDALVAVGDRRPSGARVTR
jgi:hypothetical protein